MTLIRSDLERAAHSGVITPEQVEPLWRFLSAARRDVPSFRFGHILYYLGGLIAIGAMTLFMNLGWKRFGGWGLCAIALVYAAALLGGIEALLRRGWRIPAGIAAVLVVALTPLAVYGMQLATGFWTGGRTYPDFHTWMDSRWLLMELATLAVGAALLWRYRLPFLVLPIAATLWYLSLDFAPLLFGGAGDHWETRKLVSLVFGLLMVALAFVVDLHTRSDADYPFWLYLFGALAFWGGLSLMDAHSELSRLGYLCINLVLITTGAVLSRRIFVVLGGLGTAGYLWYLADRLFSHSVLFPFALSAIGIAVVGLGLLWQRHESAVTAQLRARLPPPLRALMDRRI